MRYDGAGTDLDLEAVSSTPAGQQLGADKQAFFDASTIDHLHQPHALYLRGDHLKFLSLGVLTSKRIDRSSSYSPPQLALGFTVNIYSSHSNFYSAASKQQRQH